MRHRILEPLTATDNLALLFNAYQRGLSTFDMVTVPRESMRACNALFTQQEAGKLPKYPISDQARRYYEMTVLSNSLHGLHRSVTGALQLLTTFLTTYELDLTRYAAENRMRTIDEFGSEDESDWEPDGFDEEGQIWKVTYKDDPESLAPYTLHHDLAQFFASSEDQGERIGTSRAQDYAVYTHAVATQTELSLRKFFSQVMGKDITITQVQPDGELVPMSLADQIEDELNEDIVNANLTAEFNAVLTKCEELAQIYHTMPLDSLPLYLQLHGWLNTIMHEIPRFEAPRGFAGLAE
jgi:hypothetical protein